jgi:hypothetical protein
MGFGRLIAPPILRTVWRVDAVEIEAADLERLRSLRGERAIFTANHPSLAEPPVLFEALTRAGVSAYFLTARETMDRYGVLFRTFLQGAGCYSVMRGRRDRASMQMTQQLLVEGNRLVIFPEGQTYGLNDTLLPFQQGVVQMAFWALEEMQKRGIDAPLCLVPLAIKYVFRQSMDAEIEGSLARLEGRLGLGQDGLSSYERLRRIATAVVATLERENRLLPAASETLDDRILRLRDVLIGRIATALQVELPRGSPFPDLVRALANAYDDAVYGTSPAEESQYERGLHVQEVEAIRTFYPVWARLKNFIAVRDGYVQELPTPERYADVLGCLEIEVLGRRRIRGRRVAKVKTGDPIDLRDHAAAYRQNKRETVACLTRRLEIGVAGLLAETTGQKETAATLLAE